VQELILTYEGKDIAVVRNSYERAVACYLQGMDWIGFDTWLSEGNLLDQKKLYKNCTYFIDFKDWKNELETLDLHPKDTSVMAGLNHISDYKNWYTMKSITLMYQLYSEEINHFGYDY